MNNTWQLEKLAGAVVTVVFLSDAQNGVRLEVKLTLPTGEVLTPEQFNALSALSPLHTDFVALVTLAMAALTQSLLYLMETNPRITVALRRILTSFWLTSVMISQRWGDISDWVFEAISAPKKDWRDFHN